VGAELLRPEFVIVQKALERRLELLISVLHLLNLTGELTDLIFQAIYPDQKLGAPDLRKYGSRVRQNVTGGCNGS
jgi:hypothetical protein